MPLFTFDEPKPKLNPQISCWREDMPENHEPQLVPPQLHWLTTLNDTFLEIPRYSTEVAWGLLLLPAILGPILAAGFGGLGFFMQKGIDGYWMIVSQLPCIFALLSLTFFF